jgi:hypothetical protein
MLMRVVDLSSLLIPRRGPAVLDPIRLAKIL